MEGWGEKSLEDISCIKVFFGQKERQENPREETTLTFVMSCVRTI